MGDSRLPTATPPVFALSALVALIGVVIYSWRKNYFIALNWRHT